MTDPFPSVECPPVGRLVRRSEFLAAAKGRYRAQGALLVQMRPRQDGSDEIRVGFTATRKVGGAVVRNRAKRRMRAVARALLAELGMAGCDYVFVARNGAPDRAWLQLLDDARRALSLLARPSPEQEVPRP